MTVDKDLQDLVEFLSSKKPEVTRPPLAAAAAAAAAPAMT
jgi:hypothetical protein